ncbi:hypothetical protein [Shewanella psychromarinicola]|uniref:hypothetical protein n=1 Tax=Shewanella psychromarinicola TaxID=2487742 RepID=UPI0030033BD9
MTIVCSNNSAMGSLLSLEATSNVLAASYNAAALKLPAANVEPSLNVADSSRQAFCSSQTRQVLTNTFWQHSTNALDCLDELVKQGQHQAIKKPA